MTKPIWAQLAEKHRREELAAVRARRAALKGRCPEIISADVFGPRCTADAWPEHEHRWDPHDMPEPGESDT